MAGELTTPDQTDTSGFLSSLNNQLPEGYVPPENEPESPQSPSSGTPENTGAPETPTTSEEEKEKSNKPKPKPKPNKGGVQYEWEDPLAGDSGKTKVRYDKSLEKAPGGKGIQYEWEDPLAGDSDKVKIKHNPSTEKLNKGGIQYEWEDPFAGDSGKTKVKYDKIKDKPGGKGIQYEWKDALAGDSDKVKVKHDPSIEKINRGGVQYLWGNKEAGDAADIVAALPGGSGIQFEWDDPLAGDSVKVKKDKDKKDDNIVVTPTGGTGTQYSWDDTLSSDTSSIISLKDIPETPIEINPSLGLYGSMGKKNLVIVVPINAISGVDSIYGSMGKKDKSDKSGGEVDKGGKGLAKGQVKNVAKLPNEYQVAFGINKKESVRPTVRSTILDLGSVLVMPSSQSNRILSTPLADQSAYKIPKHTGLRKISLGESILRIKTSKKSDVKMKLKKVTKSNAKPLNQISNISINMTKILGNTSGMLSLSDKSKKTIKEISVNPLSNFLFAPKKKIKK